MDTAQWPQEIGLEKTMEENMASDAARLASEKRARPQEQLNCPRCNSTNTKFCYYNNYSLTQPRYFCKTCRRYWTEGGTLRNVPVGGGSRKNKKSTSSTASSSAISSSKNIIPDLNPPSLSHFSSQNPRMTHEGQDLNLAFSANVEHYSGTSTAHYVDHHQVPKMESNNSSALELLRSTGIASRGVNSYIPNSMQDSNAVLYSSSGFALQEFKPSQLGFCVDGLGSRYSDHPQENGGSGRLLFPFGDLKQISSTTTGHHELDQNKGQGNPTRYWNGLMGGGSW